MIRSELILIGYWHGEHSPGWPDPAAFVDTAWDEDECDIVVDYLGRGFVVRACMGYSPCRLCDLTTNGNLELSDGVYVWPEGLPHYLTAHHVKPPEPFVSHVLSMAETFETTGRNDSWWRSQTTAGSPGVDDCGDALGGPGGAVVIP